MKKIFIMAISAILIACSNEPTPNYINGGYYMVGDSECEYGDVSHITGKFVCKDKNNVPTGLQRAPISEIQAKQFYIQRQMELQALQSISNNLQQMNKQINQRFKPMAPPKN